MKLKVVVADDNAAVLTEIASLLESEFEVVARAQDGKSALECIQRFQPDVVVLDLGMPVLNGIELSRKISKMSPRPAIVICSVESDPEIVEAAHRAGALGYVFKPSMNRDLIDAVKAAANGEFFRSST